MSTMRIIPVTVNASKMPAAFSNFPYQIDLSSVLANDAAFKAQITTGANISVIDSSTQLGKPRIVMLDLANNKLLVSWDGPTSTSVNKVFWITAYSGSSLTDEAAAFGLSGYTTRYGFDNFTNDATTPDSLGGTALTCRSGATLGVSGKFGNGVSVNGTTNGALYKATPIVPTGDVSIEAIIKFNRNGFDEAPIGHSGTGLTLVKLASGALVCYSSGTGANALTAAGTLVAGNFYHLLIKRGANQITRLFVNGVDLTTDQSDALATSSGEGNIGRYSTSLYFLDGIIDEMGITSNLKDVTYAQARYNQFFDSGFWTVGSGYNVGNVIPNNNSLSLAVGCMM